MINVDDDREAFENEDAFNDDMEEPIGEAEEEEEQEEELK